MNIHLLANIIGIDRKLYNRIDITTTIKQFEKSSATIKL